MLEKNVEKGHHLCKYCFNRLFTIFFSLCCLTFFFSQNRQSDRDNIEISCMMTKKNVMNFDGLNILPCVSKWYTVPVFLSVTMSIQHPQIISIRSSIVFKFSFLRRETFKRLLVIIVYSISILVHVTVCNVIYFVAMQVLSFERYLCTYKLFKCKHRLFSSIS